MAITIGDRTIASLPADADARLIAATGCSAAEHVNMLRRSGVSTVTVATTLAALVDGSVDAGQIEAAGAPTVARQVADMLASSPAPVAQPTPTAPMVTQ